MGSPFALVVDLHPWPEPAGAMDVERLGAPLRDAFGTVRTWHPVREDGDPAGRRVVDDPDLAAVALTGSTAMVADATPWMATLAAAIDGWCRRRVPLLGTCFGHQFLAHHLGGRVGTMRERRVALEALHIVDEHDPLFEGLPPGPRLLWTHRDVVLEVPPSLLVTATSELVPVEAFRHRDLPLWGIQAHPEADASLVQAVARVDDEAAPALRRHPWRHYDTPAGDQILRRFADVAKAHAARRGGAL